MDDSTGVNSLLTGLADEGGIEEWLMGKVKRKKPEDSGLSGRTQPYQGWPASSFTCSTYKKGTNLLLKKIKNLKNEMDLWFSVYHK